MKTIIVPTDLSADTNRALSLAAAIARPHEATIVLLHSVMYPVPQEAYPGGSAVVADYIQNRHQKLEEEARQAMDRLIQYPAYSDVNIVPLLLTNTDGLVENVTKQTADLIVMTSAGASGLEEWLIGSNAEVIVRYAKCPVLVVKDPVDQFKTENIVCAVDIDDRLKADYAYPFELSEIELQQFLYVLTPSDARQPDGILEWINEFVDDKGITRSKSVIRRARTIHEGIIQYADEVDADLIVVFTQGHKGLRRLLSGSVAEDVLNHSRLPVLVMRI